MKADYDKLRCSFRRAEDRPSFKVQELNHSGFDHENGDHFMYLHR